MAGACVFISFAFWVAVATYALLYLFLIPQHVHHVPVYFDYHAHGPSYDLPGARGSGLAESSDEGAFYSSDSDRWGPTATIDLLAGRRGDWLDFGPPDSAPSAAEACSGQRTRGAAPSLPAHRKLGPSNLDDSGYHFEHAATSSSSSHRRGDMQLYSDEAARPGEAYQPVVAAVAGPRYSGSTLPSKASILTSGVAYSIALELALPNSPTNRNAGLVMVRADLHSAPTPAADSELQAARTARIARRQRMRQKRQHRQKLKQTVKHRQGKRAPERQKQDAGEAAQNTCQSEDENKSNEEACRTEEGRNSEGDFDYEKSEHNSSRDKSKVNSVGNEDESREEPFGDENDAMEDDILFDEEDESRTASYPCVVLASARRATGNAWVNPNLSTIEALALAPLALFSPWLQWWSSVLLGSSGASGSLLGGSGGSLSMVGTQKVEIPLFNDFRESAAQVRASLYYHYCAG